MKRTAHHQKRRSRRTQQRKNHICYSHLKVRETSKEQLTEKISEIILSKLNRTLEKEAF